MTAHGRHSATAGGVPCWPSLRRCTFACLLKSKPRSCHFDGPSPPLSPCLLATSAIRAGEKTSHTSYRFWVSPMHGEWSESGRVCRALSSGDLSPQPERGRECKTAPLVPLQILLPMTSYPVSIRSTRTVLTRELKVGCRRPQVRRH